MLITLQLTLNFRLIISEMHFVSIYLWNLTKIVVIPLLGISLTVRSSDIICPKLKSFLIYTIWLIPSPILWSSLFVGDQWSRLSSVTLANEFISPRTYIQSFVYWYILILSWHSFNKIISPRSRKNLATDELWPPQIKITDSSLLKKRVSCDLKPFFRSKNS